MRHPSFWSFLLVLLFVACQAPDGFGSESGAVDMDDFGNPDPPAASPGRGTVALDDVTNGLQENASRSLVRELAGGSGFTSFGSGKFRDANDDGIPDIPGQAVPRERMLVHRGDVRVEVARPEEAMTSFRSQVVAWGGHLQSQTDQTLVVRVPAPRFEEAFAWVKQTGRVLSESRQAADVTEEFVDLGIRLDNARKARDRLLEILQKADKVEDILKIEAELRRLTEEIERMEGRKKFLADQVALSTLSATFQALADAPVKKARGQASRFPWVNQIGAERLVGSSR